MKADVAIAGGGLTGLALAAALHGAGVTFHLFEARSRLGGRILSPAVPGGRVDLGPSWVWPGQPRIARLMADLGLAPFAQYATGAICLEDAQGTIHRGRGMASMEGSLRLPGGMAALVDGLAARLPADRLHPGQPVDAVMPEGLRLADGRTCAARHVVLAMPPRLAAGLRVDPPLPATQLRAMAAIPTWMAGHAKFVAVFDRPFWREQGLSGDAISRRGPLAEIHDASGPDGHPAALFGFVGLPAALRAGQAPRIEAAALGQLAGLFGPAATHPVATAWQDWAQDPCTATPADATPPPGHPAYGPDPALAQMGGGRLHLAATETAPDNGGLIEGALAAAEVVARRILAQLA